MSEAASDLVLNSSAGVGGWCVGGRGPLIRCI